jgi:hypothetical protein
MLRRSRFLSRSALTGIPPKTGAGLFHYKREIDIAPGQLFGRELVLSNIQHGKNQQQLQTQPPPRRWARGADELCVAQLLKSTSLLTTYEATYRFNDPQWNPILSLPVGNPVALELRARHINYGLRHLVQKGHAFYVVRKVDHSVFHPKGLAAVSHVMCSFDQKQERLLTQIVHEGPVDASDPDGPWAVVAASDARSLATAFNRREHLWKRSRRVGSIQSQMGTYDWTQFSPSQVNRNSACEVLILQNETLPYGAGITTKGIVSSAQIAQHPFHYVSQFEAPAQCGIDAFQQAMVISAKHNGLLKNNETLHTVAWRTRSFFPYNPIELDLPFDIHVGSPMVYRGEHLMKTLPSPSVGEPFLRQFYNNNKNKNQKDLTLIQFDVSMQQGASQYLYDEGPAYRARNWWSQRNALPYECTFWCIREGVLDAADCVDYFPPFERIRSRMHSESAKRPGMALNRVVLPEDSSSSNSVIVSEHGKLDLAEIESIDSAKYSPASKKMQKRKELGALAAGPAETKFEELYYDDDAATKRITKLELALKKMAIEEGKEKEELVKKNPRFKNTPIAPFALPSEKATSRRVKSQKALEKIKKKEAEEEEKKTPKKKLTK